jgi:hypothetical protein
MGVGFTNIHPPTRKTKKRGEDDLNENMQLTPILSLSLSTLSLSLSHFQSSRLFSSLLLSFSLEKKKRKL